ncbi:MAG: MFS transporter [Candidatus Melainabacteria bacterium]|nr:MFS transporter [Candidatus Melainabacteria bacterium]
MSRVSSNGLNGRSGASTQSPQEMSQAVGGSGSESASDVVRGYVDPAARKDAMNRHASLTADETTGTSAQKPFLKPQQLLNLCVGLIGIQFAWSMQIALSSRVLEPLGANPFLFGLIWCAGPITGLLVQPVVGSLSDRTWTFMGRRRPFILLGALLGSLALLAFPFSPTLLIAALLIWVIDACVNVSQGPYRALVPDNVPAPQQPVANGYFNAAFGVGSVIAMGVAPLLKLFHVTMSVEQQYVMSALALILFIVYTSLTIREIRPAVTERSAAIAAKTPMWKSFGRFWRWNREIHKLCGVQFLTWLGIMCMFIYLTPFIVHNVYQVPDLSSPAAKRVEALQKLILPAMEKRTTDPQALSLASIQQLSLRHRSRDWVNPASLMPVLQAWSPQNGGSQFLPEELASDLAQDRQTYDRLNRQLDIALGTVLTPGYYDQVALPQIKTILSMGEPDPLLAGLNSARIGYSEKTDASSQAAKADKRFQKLLASDPALKKMLTRDDGLLSQQKASQNQSAVSSELPSELNAPPPEKLVKAYRELQAVKQGVNIKQALLEAVMLQPELTVAASASAPSGPQKPSGKPQPSDSDAGNLAAILPPAAISQVYHRQPGAPSLPARVIFQDLKTFAQMKALEAEATNTAQWALVAFNLMALLLSIPLGHWCLKVGKKRIYSISLGFLAVAFLFAPWVTTPLQVIVMMAAAGVAWATILSVPFSFLGDYMPVGEEGTVMGIFNMFIAGPQLISATLVAWLITQNPVQTVFGMTHNWSLAFLIASGCVFLAILALQSIQEKERSLNGATGAVGH